MVIREQVTGGFPCEGNLDDLAVGDKIRCRNIDQNAPIEFYTNLRKGLGDGWNFLKNYEKVNNRKHNLSVQLNQPGRRYLLIERVV